MQANAKSSRARTKPSSSASREAEATEADRTCAPRSAKKRKPTSPDDLKWCRAFLAALAKGGSPCKAARLARVNEARPYQFRKESPEFARLWAQAKISFRDSLRAEAQARAVVGWLEPVYQGGKRVGQIRKKSEQILLAMLRANCKEYRDRVDLSVTIRERARKVAEESGLSEAEILAVAERIATGAERP